VAQANSKQQSRGGIQLPPGLTDEDLLDLYGTMVLSRAIDERVWMLNRQGKAALVASAQGHEAAQLGTLWALRKHAPEFFCFAYYRDLALWVGQGLSARDVLLGYTAKEGEPISGARQFPMHGAAMRLKVMNLSNVVAAHVTHAVGWALASKLRNQVNVAACFFGDGAASQGEVHESMNFAAVQRLPVVFFVENNRYAISLPIRKQMAIERVAQRAQAYGMPGVTVDGTDVLAVYGAAAEAVQRAVKGGGPSLVEFDVERYLPHTSDDDDSRYRDRAEVEAGRLRDPLKRLQEWLSRSGVLTDEHDAALRRQAKREVDEATEYAEAAPYPDAGDLLEHVHAPR